MKNMKKALALMLTLVMVFSLTMTSAVFAGGNSDKAGKEPKGKTEEKGNAAKESVQTQSQQSITGESTLNQEQLKAQIKLQEKEKKEALKSLKEQYSLAKKSGNPEQMQQLEEQMDQYKAQLKQMMKSRYTEQEMLQLQQLQQQLLTEDPTMTPIPVENIITDETELKLDVPPVIKDGKVLVPVRAFSEAYGAEVKWNAEDHTVTIVKEGMEIVIKTDSSTVLVNGVETDLGLPVKAINGRNVMPVGFLAAKLGLKVEVDEEDGTVEIDEDAEEETEGDILEDGTTDTTGTTGTATGTTTDTTGTAGTGTSN